MDLGKYRPKSKYASLKDFVGKNIYIIKISPYVNKRFNKPGFEIVANDDNGNDIIFHTIASTVVEELNDLMMKSENGEFEKPVNTTVESISVGPNNFLKLS